MNLLSCLRTNLQYRKQILTNFMKEPLLKCPQRSFRKKLEKDGGMKLAPQIGTPSAKEDSVIPTIVKCFTFGFGFCGTVYAGCAIWNYENTKHQFNNKNMKEWINIKWNQLEGFEHKSGKYRKLLNQWWNEQPDGRKLFWAICAINALVFICWHYPPFQSSMMTYFCCSPVGKAVCWPMVLSTFSHFAPFHFGVNMYVLHSFSGAIGHSLGCEQFLAFYIAGGVFSSLFSNCFKLTRRRFGPSLGASGAIMALLGYFCTKYPDAQLGIVFLPNMPFSADSALKGVMLLDLTGIILRWKLFDHAAHLGGAIFGLLYALYGESAIWGNRHHLTKYWEEFNREFRRK